MKNILYILLICALSSCGLFKRSSKNKSIENVQVTTNNKVEQNNNIVDKSTVKITEKLDTVITTKEITTKGVVSFHPDSLIKGLTSLSNDLVDVKLTINNGVLTTTATLKPQTLPLSFNKVTETQKNITSTNKSSSQENKTGNSRKVQVAKKSEPAKMGVWFIGLIVVCVLVFALFKFRK